MATTETLEKFHWHDKNEQLVRTLQADTIVRVFQLNEADWSSLVPSVADTFSTETTQIVGKVERGKKGSGGDIALMIVTYLVVSNKGFGSGDSAGYAETRRVYHETKLREHWTLYGIATAVDAAGIPDVGDILDAGTALMDARCVDAVVDDRVYPGLWQVTSKWSKAKSHV
jgi:hypothetical protein